MMRIIIFLCLILGIPAVLKAQETVIKGIVTDAKNNEPLPFVSVFFKGTLEGTVTDFEGQYVVQTGSDVKEISFSILGYKTVSKPVIKGKEQVLNIKLEASVKELNEFVVSAKKSRYRNKNNPAVDLIRKVIDNKGKNHSDHLDYYEYEKYEKIEFALSDVSEKLKSRRAMRKFQFVFENTDSTKLEGKKVLPIFLKETLADVFYRKSPKAEKELVKGNKMVSFEGYVDDKGLTGYLKYLYQDIDIYANNITLLTNQFLSPVSNVAPTFYKFFITDSVTIEGKECYELTFEPRNKTEFLFEGQLYITKDSSYAVRKVNMTVNKNINLNWVKELKISQDFEYVHGSWLLAKDEFSADFGLSGFKSGLFGQRSVSRKKQLLNESHEDSVYDGEKFEIQAGADSLPDSFWEQSRHEELTKSEKGIYSTIDSVKKVPAFRRTLNVITVLSSGYKSFGPFEIGPMNTFYSFNPIEGFRLRIGGRTTPKFSKRTNLETYIAYGFEDKRPKYYGGITYSLTRRTIWEFPVKFLKMSYQYETRIPGQELQFVQEDNILLSFKRGVNDKWLYNRTVNLEFQNEFANHLSFTAGYKYLDQEPAGGLKFNRVDYNEPTSQITHLVNSELSLSFRYAPGEQFYMGKTYRIPISNKKPVFRLRYIAGIKDLFGGEYSYHNLIASVSKRLYLSAFGYSDFSIEAGKLFGNVPYPLLDIHRANQTYSYQTQAYNLMNFLEFVSDQYVAINYDHYVNGAIFNKIPLFKRLGWREVFTVKALYGSLSKGNNPSENPALFKFPVNEKGELITYTLQSQPYVEGSVGIANIFKFFRVDLVKRFTYLDHPGITTLGLRVRFKFDF